MKKNRILIAVCIGIVLLIIGWMLQSDPPKPETVRFGYLPIASDASFFVAVEQGYFANQGLQIEPVKFETSNQALEALSAGRIDATAPVALETALALEANTPNQFQIVEMTAATADTKVHRIMVKSDSKIQSLADLRNKKIGTFPGTQMVVFLKLILGRYFDAEKEVEILQLKQSLQPQALETSQIDAIFCLEPTCTQLEANGLARSISINPLYEYILQPFPTAATVISTEFGKQNPETIRKIIAALQLSHEFIKTQPQQASLSVPKYAPIEAELAPKISLYDYWDVKSIDRNAVQKLADFYASHGIITKQIETNSLYWNQDK